MCMLYKLLKMFAMEDLFSTDSCCHKFISKRNDTCGSAQMKIGMLREDVFVNQIVQILLPCVHFSL